MNAAARREYIVAALREEGAMYEGDARAFLAEHDTAVRAELRAAIAADLAKIADRVEGLVAERYGAASGIGPGSAEMVREAARTVSVFPLPEEKASAGTAPEAAPDTLAAWLHWRFGPNGKRWDGLGEDDRSYWEHQARAVRRAVGRGGFKVGGADAALALDTPTAPAEKASATPAPTATPDGTTRALEQLAPALEATATAQDDGGFHLDLVATRAQWTAWEQALHVDPAQTTLIDGGLKAHTTWRGRHIGIRCHITKDGA